MRRDILNAQEGDCGPECAECGCHPCQCVPTTPGKYQHNGLAWYTGNARNHRHFQVAYHALCVERPHKWTIDVDRMGRLTAEPDPDEPGDLLIFLPECEPSWILYWQVEEK